MILDVIERDGLVSIVPDPEGRKAVPLDEMVTIYLTTNGVRREITACEFRTRFAAQIKRGWQ